MVFPPIADALRLRRLAPPAVGPETAPLRMVLDTDTYNEVDDQFAVAYALRSPERLRVEALYAAPFHNARSTGPADGMEKSHEEILRLMDRMRVAPEGLVHRGSAGFLSDWDHPHRSPAALDLVERAMSVDLAGEPLYVVAIGAITNVASAILIRPEIIGRIVVVWLGGNPVHYHQNREFNLMQDIPSSRLAFDCGVPLVHVPCLGVASHLLTTVPELERHLSGRNAVCDLLVETVKGYHEDHYAWAKEIWDIATIGYLVNPEWVPTYLDHSPVVTERLTWSVDRTRHLIRTAHFLRRNPIFADMFRKLAAARGE
jgi:inosine-uridine nucleoside N-ribohydrolase